MIGAMLPHIESTSRRPGHSPGPCYGFLCLAPTEMRHVCVHLLLLRFILFFMHFPLFFPCLYLARSCWLRMLLLLVLNQ
ncbi:hypothetical protein PEX2_020660 [Penicillium expansum]|uniref:Uncharacterized protein n=1 Tax=Penicillium expansum TaxID=27334 RepID=A0A0A2JQF8_PENEN|nr:hypothetical protein PEX2_020660 [Penicillium expansum]KGO44065.1 hypothetical protein PEXP_055200 [Penicillium expansum]KGO57624.1 hypothetical protein PEX2_020660 [Penicillium expansum]